MLPPNHKWETVLFGTQESAFKASGAADETYVTGTFVFAVPIGTTSKEEFLLWVLMQRGKPDLTGRFEVLNKSVSPNKERSETCVVYTMSSRDKGAAAQRGGEHTILETYGMDCIHPLKPAVGITIELSRKAPPRATYDGFAAEGRALLNSVRFGPF